MRLGIDELKAIQAKRGLRDIHLVSLDEHGYTIAHTDNERARAASGGTPLEECELHLVLGALGHAPAEPGIYKVERTSVDGYSTSFRSDALGWSFFEDVERG